VAEGTAAGAHGARHPAVSVVVATYRRPERLARLLRALEGQTFDEPWEVVVVDDASPEDDWHALQHVVETSSVPVHVVRRPENGGPGRARQTGWQEARAPLIAFTDDDCTPTPAWLGSLVDHLREADLVQGRTLPHPDQLPDHGPFGRTLSEEHEGLYPTCNMGYRRAVLEQVGGFDPSFVITCEDTDLAWRSREAGAVSAWAPEALVYHDVHPSDFRAHLRDKLRWHGVALVLKRHPALRAELRHGLFWKDSHPPALLAGAGIAVAAMAAGRGGRAAPLALAAGVAATLPYVRFRTRRAPLRGVGPRRRLALVPAALVADWVEVAVMAAASVRYRTVVL
jgi:GT2 family glycosyltransferase